MSTDLQIEANRQNAQHSTGPRTEEGKQNSSKNHFKHGLSGRFQMIDGESSQDFNQVLVWMLAENPPQSTEEAMLVSKMAEYFWLVQRAQGMQADTFRALHEGEGGYGRLTTKELKADLALYIRYANSSERHLQKCMDQLLKIRGQREKAQIGFERRKAEEAIEIRKQEAHEAKMEAARAAKSKAAEAQLKKYLKNVPPGSTEIAFNQFQDLFTTAIHTFLASQEPQKAA